MTLPLPRFSFTLVWPQSSRHATGSHRGACRRRPRAPAFHVHTLIVLSPAQVHFAEAIKSVTNSVVHKHLVQVLADAAIAAACSCLDRPHGRSLRARRDARAGTTVRTG